MLRLNDDCLCEIFRRLKIREQIALTTVCVRFRDVVGTLVWSSGLFREFHTGNCKTIDLLTRSEYEVLFAAIAAEHLEKLTIADTVRLAFTSYLGRYDWRPALPFYLRLDYPRVCELEIQESGLHDAYMRLVALRFPALQVLRISSAYVTGANISEMRQLRELYMPKCSLSAQHLRAILDSTLQLTHLDITGNDQASLALGEIFDAKPGNLPPIQMLVISAHAVDAMFLRHLPRLQDLRTLRIFGPVQREFATLLRAGRFYQIFGANIVELRFGGADQENVPFPFHSQDLLNLSSLKILHLDAYISISLLDTLKAVTSLRELFFSNTEDNRALPEFIASCPHLQHIHLKYHPGKQLNEFLDWLEELIIRLEKERSTRQNPLSIYAGGLDFRRKTVFQDQNVLIYKAIDRAAEPEEISPARPFLEFRFSKDTDDIETAAFNKLTLQPGSS